MTTFQESVQAGGSIGGNWNETNGYDRWSNRWAAGTYVGTRTPRNSSDIDAATNRVTQTLSGAVTYNPAGNLTSQTGWGSFTYDAENRLAASGTATYVYDGEGRRVKKSDGATTTYYVYDGAGNLMAEYGGSANTVGGTRYVTVDHLGSTRVTTDASGAVKMRCDYTPFGEQIAAAAAQGNRNLIAEYACAEAAPTQKFTGKERDQETGLDYFGARYMSAAQGRFTSPDWSEKPQPVPYADLTNPQTLNLYSYVINNPLNRIDPLGHNWFNIDGQWQWHKGKTYTYTDSQGNQQTTTSKYTGLLVSQRTGTNAKGAATYNLTLYDQNKVVGTGTAFSGGAGHNPVKDGNYQILTAHDPTKPTAPSPGDPNNNPPVSYSVQQIDRTLNPYAEAVFQAYGPIRARLNPLSGRDAGDYFHGQFDGRGWTHGCLCYGTDTRMIDYIWKQMPNTWVGVGVDVPVVKP